LDTFGAQTHGGRTNRGGRVSTGAGGGEAVAHAVTM